METIGGEMNTVSTGLSARRRSKIPPSKTVWVATFGNNVFGIRGGQIHNGQLRGCTIRWKKKGPSADNPEKAFAQQISIFAGGAFHQDSLDKIFDAMNGLQTELEIDVRDFGALWGKIKDGVVLHQKKLHFGMG